MERQFKLTICKNICASIASAVFLLTAVGCDGGLKNPANILPEEEIFFSIEDGLLKGSDAKTGNPIFASEIPNFNREGDEQVRDSRVLSYSETMVKIYAATTRGVYEINFNRLDRTVSALYAPLPRANGEAGYALEDQQSENPLQNIFMASPAQSLVSAVWKAGGYRATANGKRPIRIPNSFIVRLLYDLLLFVKTVYMPSMVGGGSVNAPRHNFSKYDMKADTFIPDVLSIQGHLDRKHVVSCDDVVWIAKGSVNTHADQIEAYRLNQNGSIIRIATLKLSALGSQYFKNFSCGIKSRLLYLRIGNEIFEIYPKFLDDPSGESQVELMGDYVETAENSVASMSFTVAGVGERVEAVGDDLRISVNVDNKTVVSEIPDAATTWGAAQINGVAASNRADSLYVKLPRHDAIQD